MKQKIDIAAVKTALKDYRFRDALPLELKEDIAEYLHNPTCACNLGLYRKLIKEYSQYLLTYYPGREILTEEEEIKQLSQNHWSVINCKISELENKLKQLPPGRKQISMARYDDEVTVIVNELDLIY